MVSEMIRTLPSRDFSMLTIQKFPGTALIRRLDYFKYFVRHFGNKRKMVLFFLSKNILLCLLFENFIRAYKVFDQILFKFQSLSS